MAQFALHAYDADVWIPQFLGVNQSDESRNQDIRYSPEAVNVETPRGVLQPHADFEFLGGEPDDFEDTKIETIARFYRRWYDGPGSKCWLLCAAGGKIYYKQEHSGVPWMPIDLPTGVTAFDCSVWSWVTYEENVEGVDHPVDILVMSNAEDGMIVISPPDRPKTWGDIKETTWQVVKTQKWSEVMSPDWSIRRVGSTEGLEYKFGVIERYAERIWGGAIKDDPDMLVYSRPYDPLDWTIASNNEEPEDGAGSIQQPSWDGDKFTSLKSFGDQLIAFKEHRVWRIMGTDPGEYTFKEQYGGGGEFPNTIAVDAERIFLAEKDGLSSFDGMSVTPFKRPMIEKLWRTVNKNAMDQMCSCLFKNRYYLSVPVGESTVNNALIIFNLEEGTFLYYDDMNIESMVTTDEEIYATSSTIPGKVLLLNYDSWLEGKARGSAARWVSPWMDFGYKTIQKGGFDLYFSPEVQEEEVTLSVSIQTEKKTKTKQYTVKPLTEAERNANKEYRYKKLHFGGTGRKFRLIIETPEGVTAPWRIVGGLHLVVETDPD